jgi:hypothetical protein
VKHYFERVVSVDDMRHTDLDLVVDIVALDSVDFEEVVVVDIHHKIVDLDLND